MGKLLVAGKLQYHFQSIFISLRDEQKVMFGDGNVYKLSPFIALIYHSIKGSESRNKMWKISFVIDEKFLGSEFLEIFVTVLF